MPKKLIIAILIMASLFLSSCGGSGFLSQMYEEFKWVSIAREPIITEPYDGTIAPASESELFTYILAKWKAGDIPAITEYKSAAMAELYDDEKFAEIFENPVRLAGKINSVNEDAGATVSKSYTATAQVTFESAQGIVKASLADMQINSITVDVKFTEARINDLGGGILEKRFPMRNGAYTLDAAYTFSEGNTSTVIIIGDSDNEDLDGTIGTLTPYADLAYSLAQSGINSLRYDKRADESIIWITDETTYDEVYFDDFASSIDYAKAEGAGDIYALAIGLGQYAAGEAAAQFDDVKGAVVINSDMDNYDESSRYFTSLNEKDFNALIANTGKPVLFISNGENESLSLAFAEVPTVTLTTVTGIGQYLYNIDENDIKSFFTNQQFPEGIAGAVAEWLAGSEELVVSSE
jgi:hypothetical protein